MNTLSNTSSSPVSPLRVTVGAVPWLVAAGTGGGPERIALVDAGEVGGAGHAAVADHAAEGDGHRPR